MIKRGDVILWGVWNGIVIDIFVSVTKTMIQARFVKNVVHNQPDEYVPLDERVKPSSMTALRDEMNKELDRISKGLTDLAVLAKDKEKYDTQ